MSKNIFNSSTTIKNMCTVRLYKYLLSKFIKSFKIPIKYIIEFYLSVRIKRIYAQPKKCTIPNGTLLIRQIHNRDLFNIASILDQSFLHLSSEERIKYMGEMKKSISKYPAINIAAEFNGRCIGFLSSVPNLHFSKKHIDLYLNITWMAIDPNYRGYKISVEMLNHLLKTGVLMNDVKEIRTQTNVSNIPAIKAYKNLGFEKTVVIPNFICDENGIILVKKLK